MMTEKFTPDSTLTSRAWSKALFEQAQQQTMITSIFKKPVTAETLEMWYTKNSLDIERIPPTSWKHRLSL